MSGDLHVQICEGLGVRLPRATRRVVHCRSEVQAQLVLRKLKARLHECGLELHPEKTRIAYCQDVNLTAPHPTVKFTLLGYTLQPRKAAAMPRPTHPYIRTWEGWLYLAIVMDLFSRKIVGWSTRPTAHRELVLDAVMMAVRRRRPRGTVIHSDQSIR